MIADDDPNQNDPELIRKLLERDGIFLAPGETLSDEQKETVLSRIEARTVAREERRKMRREKWIRERREAYGE